MFPPAFSNRMISLLGEEQWQQLQETLEGEAPISIRYNPLKIHHTSSHFAPRTSHTSPSFPPQSPNPSIPQSLIPWSSQSHYLSTRPSFTLDPHFHAGAYYVQEASSMLIEQAIRQHIKLETPIKALDLCAAPGGKSTLITSLLHPQSFILANEVIKTRANILAENLTKWGHANTYVSQNDPDDFQPLKGFFDLVLVDAPCSGEGLFRKQKKAIEEWSTDNVQLCAARQKRILAAAVDLVAENGILIYSTCTYSLEENEQNVQWLLDNFDLESVAVDLPDTWGITQTGEADKETYSYRCYPHQVKGEGFFLACFQQKAPNTFKLKKKHKKKKSKSSSKEKHWLSLPAHQIDFLGYWFTPKGLEELNFYLQEGEVIALPKGHESLLKIIQDTLYLKKQALHAFTMKSKKLTPNHAIAMSPYLLPDIQQIALSKEDALNFLRGQPLPATLATPDQTGWALITYEGLGLGWVKVLPNRLNNYYPKYWRIKHL